MADVQRKEVAQPKSSQRAPNKKPGNSSNNRSRNNKQHIKKRVPLKPYQRKNDVYVTCKSNFKAQTKQCQEILKSDEGEVFLHAIGTAINRVINLTLIVVNESEGAYAYEANTSTIELTDDHHPLNDADDYSIEQRMNSCLHVRIFRRSKYLET